MITKAPVRSSYLLSAVLIASWTAAAFSQGSGSSRTSAPRATRPQTPDEFHGSFWAFVAKPGAAYNTWKVLTREKADADVENPHSTISKTYANKIAADDPEHLPLGSILVREDYDSKNQRKSISVMYRVKGYDPEFGNWYWFKYQENGSVARGTDNKPVAGKVKSCTNCHSNAYSKDFVFSNDTEKSTKDSPKISVPKPPKE